MKTPKILTVYVAGVEPAVSAGIAALLDDQRLHLDSHWQIADHADADLLIVDTDSLYGHMDWLKASAMGRLVATCGSVSSAGDVQQLRLAAPIVADGLVALLNRVSSQLKAVAVAPTRPTELPTPAPLKINAISASNPVEAAPCPSAAAPRPATSPLNVQPRQPVTTPTPDPVAERTRTQSRGLHLADLLDVDSPLKGPLRLAAAGVPTLFLDPHHRSWHSESTLKALTAWCARELSSLDVQSVDEAQFSNLTAKTPGQPYARLKWLTHLVQGDGELDAELDPNARYKLARWPQSEREFPKHFRIAATMLKQAASPHEIAAQAGATIGDVADFINGYHAVGYIEQDLTGLAQDDLRGSALFGRPRKVSTN